MTTTTKSDDHSQSVGIMYPVDWPTDDPEAHCTLVYLGEIPDANFTQEDLYEALAEVDLEAPGPAHTKEIEFFGEDNDIPVVPLDSMRAKLQKKQLLLALNQRGIKDASSFPQYKPHVTLQNPDVEVPDTITLEAPQIWWGGERLERR
jgi:2'-5' RNA ligase